MLGGFLELGIATRFPSFSHWAGLKSQFHRLLAVCWWVSSLASQFSHLYHSDNDLCLESLTNLQQFSHVTISSWYFHRENEVFFCLTILYTQCLLCKELMGLRLFLPQLGPRLTYVSDRIRMTQWSRQERGDMGADTEQRAGCAKALGINNVNAAIFVPKSQISLRSL